VLICDVRKEEKVEEERTDASCSRRGKGRLCTEETEEQHDGSIELPHVHVVIDCSFNDQMSEKVHRAFN
jgi:Trm5-related predicted tRNA methylase